MCFVLLSNSYGPGVVDVSREVVTEACSFSHELSASTG
jgi:hypothetical protein